jgi:CRP-like cAMP-binding protein
MTLGADDVGRPGPDPPWFPGTLLGRLEPRTRDELLRLGITQHVDADRAIIEEGKVESHVVILRRAVTKVTVAMADGRQALVGIRVSGDIVGEISAFNDTPRSATVTTCGPSVISVIHRGEFQPFLRGHPDAAIGIAGIVADRLRWANRRRVDFASYPVKVRLARVLADLAAAYGYRVPSGIVIGVRLIQPELATLCGAADISLQRALGELRVAGIVDTGYRRIIVLDPVALRRAADLEPPGGTGH